MRWLELHHPIITLQPCHILPTETRPGLPVRLSRSSCAALPLLRGGWQVSPCGSHDNAIHKHFLHEFRAAQTRDLIIQATRTPYFLFPMPKAPSSPGKGPHASFMGRTVPSVGHGGEGGRLHGARPERRTGNPCLVFCFCKLASIRPRWLLLQREKSSANLVPNGCGVALNRRCRLLSFDTIKQHDNLEYYAAVTISV